MLKQLFNVNMEQKEMTESCEFKTHKTQLYNLLFGILKLVSTTYILSERECFSINNYAETSMWCLLSNEHVRNVQDVNVKAMRRSVRW